MNKLWLVFVAFFFVGCASIPTTMPDRFYSLDEINEWIYYNIDYVGSDKSEDEAQTPAETMALRSGVCIDMCYLFVKLADGWTTEIVGIVLPTGGNHAIIRANTGWYDPTNGKFYTELPRGWKVMDYKFGGK